MRLNRWQLAAGLAVAVVVGLLAPTASADGSVTLGGGAGITINGTNCTLTTIGHDGGGALVGFTAGSCGGPGSPVVSATAQPAGPLGTVATTVGGPDSLDYSVIKFDPAKVSPTANFDGLAINGFGPDPSLSQPACFQGGATGQACGSVNVQAINRPSTVMARFPVGHTDPGDDGAPVTVNGQLVGMVRNARLGVNYVVPQSDSRIGFVLFSAIMNDVNAKGAPGAWFSPIPG
jgi:hypothetical protein